MTDEPRKPTPEDERTLSISGEETIDGPGADRVPGQPESIGGFRIIDRLGEGGMGTVWEAEQSHPRRRVALKIMRRDHVVDELHARMFRREAESLARLRHPNIAAIYESGHTEDGHDFFAMELVPGVTLDVWLAGRPAPVDGDELKLRLGLFRSICDAVHYAHQRGVIHRDLKPSNIIVTDEGVSSGAGSTAKPSLTIKILDFGLARITDADIAATLVSEIGVIKGTLQYMSPEQARGDVAAIDVRSDVYALGVILYEMLTGKRPYNVSRAALAEAVRVICEDSPEPVGQSWSGTRRLDQDLVTIVGKTLEKEADRRYDSAAALREDVERYLASQPILARAPSAVYQLKKMVQRNRLGAVFAATVLALVVVLAVTMTVQANRIARERDRAEIEAAKATAINEFMLKMLGSANPWEESRAVTVVEALDQARQTIDSSFSDQPLIEAAVRQTLGSTYYSLARFEEAEELLLEALATRTRELGPRDDETARSLARLGQLYWRWGNQEEAERYAREVLEIRQRTDGGLHPEIAESHGFMARVMLAQGDYEVAEEHALEALRTARLVDGEVSWQTADAYDVLSAIIQLRNSEFERAAELARTQLGILRQIHGDDVIEISMALNNLAVIEMNLGDYEGAISSFEESLAISRLRMGDNHPEVATIRENLGGLYFRMGRYDESLALLDEVIGVRRAFLGEDSAGVARTMTNQGAVYQAAGRTEEAVATLVEAVKRMERAYGDDHPDVASTYRSLGTAQLKNGDLAAAEASTRRGLEIAAPHHPDDAPTMASHRLALGSVLVERGRYGEAEGLLLAAHENFTAAFGLDDRRTAAAAAELVELYEAWGRPENVARYRAE